MRTWFRLAWRTHRIELTLLGLAAIAGAGWTLVLSVQMGSLKAADPGCFIQWIGTGEAPEPSAACQRLFQYYYGDLAPWADRLVLALLSAPFALGLILGAPVVGAEIEHRTAGMSWTLSVSRGRWLFVRVAPLITFTAIALVVVSIADGPLEAVLGRDIGFWRQLQPWPLLVVRGLLALAIGVGAGALVGRVLPALFVALIASAVIFGAISLAIDRWQESEAVAIPETQRCDGCSRFFDEAYRNDSTGEVTTTHQYFGVAEGQPVFQSIDEVPGMTIVVLRVPGSRYPDFVLRESLLTGALAVAVGGLSLVAIKRRRPY